MNTDNSSLFKYTLDFLYSVEHESMIKKKKYLANPFQYDEC